jgi:sugar (pentulose or hexulose) kinase
LQDVDTLCIVGGGARNHFLRQLVSDVFNARTYLIRNAGYAAPLGCAISGARATLGISYEEAVDRFVAADESSYRSPVGENTRVARKLLNRYRALEDKAPV